MSRLTPSPCFIARGEYTGSLGEELIQLVKGLGFFLFFFLDPSCPKITEQMCRCLASGTHDRGCEEREHRQLKWANFWGKKNP